MNCPSDPMTHTSLRTLMARAFAKEQNGYYIGTGVDGVCIMNNDGTEIVGPSSLDTYQDAKTWINERGLMAAMRVAAENVGQCEELFSLIWEQYANSDITGHRSMFETVTKSVCKTLGEIT